MSAFVQTVNDLQSFLFGASPFMVVFLCGMVFGYVIKSIPFLDNRMIPMMVIIACSVMYRYSQKVTDLDCQNWYRPEIRLYLLGALIGFAAWIAHAKYLRKWIDDKWFEPHKAIDKPDLPA